jgi:hypothetical protein
MRNNETGELELVVGNRQLMSGFFIVVLLLAVAFAMGYILGQNSPRSAKVQAEAPAASQPVAAEGRPQPAAPAAPPVEAAPDANAAAPGAGDAAEQGPQPTTQAAKDTQPAAQPPAATAPAQTAASKASDAPLPAAASAQAAANGSFWQVIAIRDSEAEILVKTLKEKGYPASTAPGPNSLVRVLVGPYSDTPTMGRVKTELEGLGFHPIRR